MTTSIETNSQKKEPRPFVKWAGGKRQLIGRLRQFYPKDFGTYFEPFLGGAAIFFDLISLGYSFNAFLSDTNKELMTAYKVIKNNIGPLIEILNEHKKKYEQNSEKYFYEVRSSKPLSEVEKAAKLIFLNKTCFNGLYRVNSKGEFNVPFGRNKCPKICDASNLQAVSLALSRSNAKLFATSFEKATKDAKEGDFVYFDPPYHPLSSTANFTNYTRKGFSFDGQRNLAISFSALHERGCYVLLTNSNATEILSLYRKKYAFVNVVPALRVINCKGNLRKGCNELIISNYKIG